ncbi:tolloid-like protein 2 isoform X2 [Porites lutea]|uniref:tolloid-like protein 2 isoform X2 n=1 Tax=Porites lutea TaxID=51062 RepID=UPI003CC52C10
MNMTCGWFITAPENQTVKLQLTSRLSSSYKSSDRVEVYDVDGSELSANNLRLSNPHSNTDTTIYSKFRSLYILFKSDSHPQESLSESGMLVLYTAFETVRTCSSSNSKDQNMNIILKDRSGIIKTPGYPSNFPTNLITQCCWKILAPKNHVVRLDFISFRMGSSHCVYIHDSINKENPVETFKCRSKTSFTFYASGREASLSVYRIPYSDVTSGSGFIANYSVTPIAAMGPCNITGVDNVIPLTGETGRLFSPLYPQTYPNDMMCTWKITVPEGNFVRLRITSFDLGFSCRVTALKIHDGQSSSGNLLKSFCGRTFDRSVFSSGRYLWVRFQSPKDGYVYGTGFNAVFEAVTQLPAPFSCRSDRLTSLKSDTGTLASYNYPLPYDDKIECTWTIRVDLDYRIRLSFDFFNLSQSSDCSVDYVEVRDGAFTTSDLIGKYCGTEKPESITSDSWDMRVTFKSSGKTNYPGFKASYKRKKSTTAILKIVGIVLGALSSFCALVAGCCKYCCNSNNSRDAPVVQDSENINQIPGFNNYTSQEQVATTKM